jgi:hypothetical protein
MRLRSQTLTEVNVERLIARERAGEGAVEVSVYNMKTIPVEETPDGAFNTAAWFGVNERDEEVELFWATARMREFAPEHVLYTGQTFLSPTAIKQTADARPPRVVSVNGEDWIIDGHHRIARARARGHAIEVAQVIYEEALSEGCFDVLLGSEEDRC